MIVDLAAENGGNCALTQPGEVVERHGVHIVGYVDLPSRLAPTASQLYGSNLAHLLADMGGAKSFHIDPKDEVIRGSLVVKDGQVLWPPPPAEKPAPVPEVKPAAPPSATAPAPAPKKPEAARRQTPAGRWASAVVVAGGGAGRAGAGGPARVPVAPDRVRAGLRGRLAGDLERHAGPAHAADERHQRHQRHHRGGGHVAAAGRVWISPVVVLGGLAILLATINVAGGFLVTQRMLRMFRR